MIIQKTVNTPYVELNLDKRQILLEGESRPEDVRSFYEPILHWIDSELSLHLIDEEDIEILFESKLDYFNSSSAKYILDIVEQLKEIKQSNIEVAITINWYYDKLDVDMLDAGKEFSLLTELPFNYISNEA